jgi:subtilisin-like proprotein convertase family protein
VTRLLTQPNTDPHTLMKSLFILLLTPALGSAAVVFSQVFPVNTAIPDNNTTGLLNSQTLTGTNIASIQGITVTLNLSGGWNGDLYAYLARADAPGFAVLLNRIGSADAGLFDPGSGSSGFAVTFDDAAPAGDIHTGVFTMGQPVTGVYAPDGRASLPWEVKVTDPRTALLSSFIGLSGDGVWELFVADVSTGDVATLESWELVLTGQTSAIPEPAGTLGVVGLLTSGLLLRVRKRRPACQPLAS